MSYGYLLNNDKVTQGKFFSRIATSIILLIALPVCLAIVHFLTKILTDEGEIFHWVSIVLSVVACGLGGALAGDCNYDTEFWMKPRTSDKFRERICDPIGKTVGEVDAIVKKHFKKDEYNVGDLTVVIGFLVFDLVIVGLSLFITVYSLNFLVAFPVWIFFALVMRLPSGQSYVSCVRGKDWEKYVCPHCGGICAEFDYTRKNIKEDVSLGSRYVTVTDEYTDGVDTLYVDRTQKEYFIQERSSWDQVYRCPRCKKTFEEHFSYTKEI